MSAFFDLNGDNIIKALNNTYQELVEKAREVREQAYAPYSHFRVGAALLGKSGQVYTGVNVENVAYGAGICAERGAMMTAVAAGERDFEAVAVVADTTLPTAPCGMCRQFMAEFGTDLAVIVANLDKIHYTTTLAELLPSTFDQKTLHSNQEEK